MPSIPVLMPLDHDGDIRRNIVCQPGSGCRCPEIDSAESFGMIRAGKVDLTVLGAMEVSDTGDMPTGRSR